MVTSSDSSEKLNYSGGDDGDDCDFDFCSLTPPPDHNKRTHLSSEKLAEIHGLGEPSAQPFSSSSGDIKY